MLEAEELPACITDLNTTLTEMKAKDLTHFCKGEEERTGRDVDGTGVCRVM
jgi:hypothetical protein